MPARSPVSRSSASSTSRPRRRWPMAGQAARRPQDRGLRPRWRHLRYLDHRDRRVDGEHQFEVLATNGDTFLGGEDFDLQIIRLPGERVRKRERDRHQQGPAGHAAAEGGGREGQDRAVFVTADRDQPALYHGRRQRSEASEHQADPGQAGVAGGVADQAHHRALPSGGQGRRPVGQRDRRRDLVGGQSRMPKVSRRSRISSARTRVATSTRTKPWPSARRSRAACWPATSRTCCCST